MLSLIFHLISNCIRPTIYTSSSKILFIFILRAFLVLLRLRNVYYITVKISLIDFKHL